MDTTILSFEDRVVIETLHHEKHSLQYIADIQSQLESIMYSVTKMVD